MGELPLDLDDLLADESEIQRVLPSLTKTSPVTSSSTPLRNAGSLQTKASPAPHGKSNVNVNNVPPDEPDLDALLEEENEIHSSAGELPTAKPTAKSSSTSRVQKKSYACESCGQMTVSNSLMKEFKVKVCYPCKKTKDKYKMMSKATAKSQFLLTDKDLNKLDSITVKNPRRTGWNDMRLFITFQVHAKCIEKFGSLEAMEKTKMGRAEQRIQKREKSAQEEGQAASSLLRNIKQLRTEVAIGADGNSPSPKRKKKEEKSRTKKAKSEPKYVKRYHTHTYGPSTHKHKDIWTKKCTECGFQLDYEVM